jgi:F0F1-type ATP synthase assembly protein I
MISFGFFVPSFFLIGVIFIGLWAAAIIVGRKGEAARAALMAQAGEKA